MLVNFTKMQGAGNDYVYINCFKEDFTAKDAKSHASFLSDRHKGIGADGVILIMPSEAAHAKMRMFNVDGSEAEMCGNGLRCVCKYVYERGISKANPLSIETIRGVLQANLTIKNDLVELIEINMDKPILEGLKIPTIIDKPLLIDEEIVINKTTYKFTAVSMGNPHAVIYVSDLYNFDVEGVGKIIEHHPLFPNRMHAEFVEIISRNEVLQRTWERGSGETLACGTGACAVCVAGVISKRTEQNLLIHLLGGDLEIFYDAKNSGNVFMKGLAKFVFEGSIEINLTNR